MKKIFSKIFATLLSLTALFDLSVIGYLSYVFYSVKTGVMVFSAYGMPLSIALIVVNSVIILICLIYFILKKIR